MTQNGQPEPKLNKRSVFFYLKTYILYMEKSKIKTLSETRIIGLTLHK